MGLDDIKNEAEEMLDNAVESVKDFVDEAGELTDRIAQAVHEYRSDRAFRSGVETTSDLPVIYIDPKELQSKDPEQNAAILKEQMEEQVPGSSDMMIERFKKLDTDGELDGKSNDEILSEFAEYFSSISPAAMSDIMIDGQEYCIINKASDDWDTKAELIQQLSSKNVSSENIDKNFPGNDHDWNEAVGLHEGEHCNKPEDAKHDYETLHEEGRADRSMMQHIGKEMAQAIADARHLGSYGDDEHDHDTVHSTGPLLGDKTEASVVHIAVAPEYREIMYNAVEEAFDWDNYEGDAYDAEDLLKENPEAYFEALNRAIDEVVQESVENYNEDPSEGNRNELILSQVALDYIGNFEDAYRRRELGQDVPAREPSQLVPKEVEEQFYADLRAEREAEKAAERLAEQQKNAPADVEVPLRPTEDSKTAQTPTVVPDIDDILPTQQNAQPDVQVPYRLPEQEQATPEEPSAVGETPQEVSSTTEADKGYQKGVDGTAFTTKVDTQAGGEPNVDFDKGVTVANGVGVTNFFSQNANPDPQDVSMVNATQPTVDTPQIDPALLAAQQSEPTQSAQTLG